MESVICSVKDIEAAHRQVIEHVIGRRLTDNQRLIIRVVSEDVSDTQATTVPEAVTLPDWCNVYEGLSDAEVSAIEELVLMRADLTRDAE